MKTAGQNLFHVDVMVLKVKNDCKMNQISVSFLSIKTFQVFLIAILHNFTKKKAQTKRGTKTSTT